MSKLRVLCIFIALLTEAEYLYYLVMVIRDVIAQKHSYFSQTDGFVMFTGLGIAIFSTTLAFAGAAARHEVLLIPLLIFMPMLVVIFFIWDKTFQYTLQKEHKESIALIG